MAAVLIPNFMGRKPRYEREQFIAQLNALTSLGWQQAIITHKVHKVHVDFANREIRLEVVTGKNAQGESVSELVRGQYLNTKIEIPDNIKIKNFIIEGVDEMKRFGGGAGEAWFYIIPEGLAQNVIINFVDTKDTLSNGKVRPVGLVLNPFFSTV